MNWQYVLEHHLNHKVQLMEDSYLNQNTCYLILISTAPMYFNVKES